MRGQRTLLFVLVAVLSCGLAAPAAEPGGGRQGGEGRGDRGQRDPAEMQKRMEEFRQRASEEMKKRLGVTDDAEWKVIETRMNAVNEAQNTLRSGRGGFPFMGGGPGGRGGGRRGGDNAQEPQTEMGKKMAALREVLDKEKPEPAEIKKALTEYRDARKKAEEDLAKARASLREVLTQRQEAQLVMMGTLD